MEKQIKIDANKMYSLMEITRKGLIPGIKSYPTIRNKFMEQKVIKVLQFGEGKSRKNYVKGKDLIKFLDHIKAVS